MNLTDEFIKSLNPCQDGYKYWIKVGRLNLGEFCYQCKSEGHLDWANWLIVRCMKRKQRIEYAVFAAEQVIDIYEEKYPNNKKPREAIEAAKKVLKYNSKKNGAAYAAYAAAAAYADAAYAASDAAYAASDAAYAASDAAYAAAAADAAYAAAYTAYADADAAYAAYTAYVADRGKMRWTIIQNGLKIMGLK